MVGYAPVANITRPFSGLGCEPTEELENNKIKPREEDE